MAAIFRVTIILILVIGAAWFIQESTEEPGYVMMNWYGYEIETSMTFIIAVFNIGLILAFYGGRLLEWVLEIPARFLLKRKYQKDQNALSLIASGLKAIAAGDHKEQEKLAQQITKLLPESDVAPVLAAHLHPTQERLHLLLGKPETAFSGHVGLMGEAQKRSDWHAVKFHAQGALDHRAHSPVIQQSLFNATLHMGLFEEALDLLPKLKKSRVLGKQAPFVEAAVRLHAAMAEKNTNPTNALRQTSYATKACPHFVPGALFQASTLLSLGKSGPAERALSDFWHTCPRYDVFNKWWEIVQNTGRTQTAAKLYKKVEALTESKVNNPDDGAIALLCRGTAALDLGDIERARDLLTQAFRQSASKQILQKLAEVEQKIEDEAAAGDWLEQAVDAPNLHQQGDDVLALYQEFRQTYKLDQPSALPSQPADKKPRLMLANAQETQTKAGK